MNTMVRESRDVERGQSEQFVAPTASVVEDADGYLLQVEMPGVNKEGLEISLEDNELTIIGRRSLPTVDGTLIHHESRQEISGARSSSTRPSMGTRLTPRSSRAS
jgi:HSP20 family molecular chaperone IbpA